MACKLKDLTGKRFTRWLVLSRADINKDAHPAWNCICDCGTKRIVAGISLKNGSSKSCGCLRNENLGNKNRTHGRSQTKEWSAWSRMKQRCSSNDKRYFPYYKNRGIKICDRWNKFENFFADMGKCPEGRSLDRIDNNGNYEPSNCRWATTKEQMRNRSCSLSITYNGETLTYLQWAKRLGTCHDSIIHSRLKRGWSEEKTVTTPIKQFQPALHKKINALEHALKIQALKTAYYNGYGKPNSIDLKQKHPTGKLLWECYLCNEGKQALGLEEDDNETP